MTYEEVFEVIARYCPRASILFGDKWQRFPTGEIAEQIINMLGETLTLYELLAGIDHINEADLINNARCEILRRMK